MLINRNESREDSFLPSIHDSRKTPTHRKLNKTLDIEKRTGRQSKVGKTPLNKRKKSIAIEYLQEKDSTSIFEELKSPANFSNMVRYLFTNSINFLKNPLL